MGMSVHSIDDSDLSKTNNVTISIFDCEFIDNMATIGVAMYILDDPFNSGRCRLESNIHNYK